MIGAFVLASATFAANARMPLRTVYTGCGGANRSPELHWTAPPKGTKSLALVVHDPDAPHPGGWYHWVVDGLAPGVRDLPAGSPPRAAQGTNDFGDRRYDGPCPPPGKPHHYHFTLYALNAAVPAPGANGPELLRAIAPHVIARAELTGIYQR